MRISAKIDYACRALVELSLHWPNHIPVQIQTIAQAQQIPLKFLTQILLSLKQLGYVKSTRGKKGGYLLSKAPKKIKLSALVEGFGGLGFSAAENKPVNANEHIMNKIWQDVNGSLLKALDEVDFEVICDRKRKQDRSFMFQI